MKLVRPFILIKTDEDDVSKPIVDLFAGAKAKSDSNTKSVGSIIKTGEVKTTKKKSSASDNKSKKPVIVTGETINAEIDKKERNPLNSNMTYNKTYEIPKRLLAQSMMQVDDMLGRVNEDINNVRALKFSKNKYDYLNSLYAASNTLISNRISIARELSSIQNNVNRYELARHKELASVNSESDEKRLMELYTGFVNANTSTMPQSLAAQRFNMPPQNLNSPFNGIPISATDAGIVRYNEDSNDDPGYQAYMSNLSPEQNAMINESNPYIQTMLVYDQGNQNRWFEVIDTRTGEQVPNMPLPPDFIKDGCIIDIRNGMARNTSLNKTYKLKVVGFRSMDEF